jgi:hypothetical protein
MGDYEYHAIERKDDGSFRMRLIITTAIILYFFGKTMWLWVILAFIYIFWRML